MERCVPLLNHGTREKRSSGSGGGKIPPFKYELVQFVINSQMCKFKSENIVESSSSVLKSKIRRIVVIVLLPLTSTKFLQHVSPNTGQQCLDLILVRKQCSGA